MTRRPSTHRGAALLLVLIALAVISAGSAALVSHSSQALTTSRASLSVAEASWIARDVQPAMITWLDSGSVAGEKSGQFAEFRIIREFETQDILVTIRAIDLSGRIHVDLLKTELRSVLPLDVEARLKTKTDSWPGDETLAEYFDYSNSMKPLSSLRILTWLTTFGDGRLNIRSADHALLEIALAGAESSIARSILDRRRAGEPIPHSLAKRAITTGPNSRQDALPLTDQSSAMGFLVSITRHGTTRTWWTVYEYIADTGVSGRRQYAWALAEHRLIES